MPDQPSATRSGAGFAAAAQPISAETIHTDSHGLDASDVRIPAGGDEIPAYYARPEKGSELPIILVVHELFAVHEHTRDICRRLGKLGYFAIAPDLYARQGDVSQTKDTKDIIANVVSKVPDRQALSDLDAAAAFAVASGKCNASRLGITGFCWGGRITWLYAAHNPALKASVAWYGKLVGDTDELHPANPIDIVPDLKCPVLGLYGAQDQSIPLDTIEKVRNVVRRTGKNCEIVVYPDAGHAFNSDYRPNYRKPEAEDAWHRMQVWFKQYLAM